MSGKKKYEDFPLSLAFFDALPVLFFCCAVLVIGMRYRDPLFLAGSVLCTLAGVGKVTWKIIIAGTRRDIVWMNRQLRVVMPVGFVLILAGLFTGGADWTAVRQMIFSFPAGLSFAVRLDGTKVRNNWIEQITNAIAQGCLLIGVLLCV